MNHYYSTANATEIEIPVPIIPLVPLGGRRIANRIANEAILRKPQSLLIKILSF